MLDTLQGVFTLIFVVASMFGMGLGVTPRELVRPLRSGRLVVGALVANFGIVPLAAWILAGYLDEPLAIGLILAGATAGAPFALKLADVAEADVGLALSLVVLLVVGTTVFLPLTVRLLLPGAGVSGWAVARQLGTEMLLPLVVGMAMRWRYSSASAEIRPDTLRLANVALVLLLALLAIRDTAKILGLFGSGAILAVIALLGFALLSGWVLGGPTRDRRATLALATGHRNYAAAFVVATADFPDEHDVLVLLAAASALSLGAHFLVAGELRRRHGPPVGPELPA